MREYELSTLHGFQKQNWLVNRQERQRFSKCIRKWKAENPKATIIQEMLIESLVRLHIFEQRLCDQRIFFFGEKTDYSQVTDHKTDVDSEDLKVKQKEFETFMPQIQRWKTDLLKLAMANSINVNLDGTVSDLFRALDNNGASKKTETSFNIDR